MAAAANHRREYFLVFLWLGILTVIELAVPAYVKDIWMRGSALVGLACGKAFLVAYYYMHLKEEKGWLKFIAAIPISAGVYALVVILESLYR